MYWTADLESMDKSLTLWLNDVITADAVNPAWALITDKHSWWPVYALLFIYVLWRAGWKKTLIILAAVGLSVLLADRISVAVKLSTERFRPCYDEWMLANGVDLPIGQGGGKYGFFSGHAANSFALVTCLILALRTGGIRKERVLLWGGFFWATLMAVSRVATARHFFGDIFVGAVFGIAVGLLSGYLARWAIRKITYEKDSNGIGGALDDSGVPQDGQDLQ